MSSYPQSQAPRRSRKRHKPIARVTSYDYNVRYDLRRKMETKNNRNGFDGLFAAPIHDESYDVMEGETLMSINKSQAYRDGAIHCFSFANGLGADIPSGLKRALDGPDNDGNTDACALPSGQRLLHGSTHPEKRRGKTHWSTPQLIARN